MTWSRTLPISLMCLAVLAMAVVILRDPPPNPERDRRSAAELFAKAEQALDRDDLPAARTLLEKCLKLDDDHATARLYLGQLQRESGDVEGARALWRSVNEDDGTAAEVATARFLEGTLAIEQGRPDLARDDLEEALRLNPGYLDAREKLILVNRMLRKPQAMLDQIDQIARERPLMLDELILRTIPLDSVFSAEESRPILEASLAANPTDVDLQLAYLRVLREQEETEQAWEFLQTLPPDTQNDDLIAMQMLTLLDLGLIEEAKAVPPELNRWPRESLDLERARTAIRQREGEFVAGALHHLVARSVNDRDFCYQTGLALRKLGDIAETEAEGMLQRAVLLDDVHRDCVRLTRDAEVDPGILLPMATRIAQNLQQLGRNAEAADWFALARQFAPHDEELARRYQQVITRVAEGAATKVPRLPQKIFDREVELDKERIRRQQEAAGAADGSPSSSLSVGTIAFADVAAEAGLDFQYDNGQTGFEHLIESMGGGVLVLDFDTDGWPDLYFPQGGRFPTDEPHQPVDPINSSTPTDQLWRNDAGRRFVRVSPQSGLDSPSYGLGGTVADFNNDGFDDLFVANFGRNILYRNNGDGTFTEWAAGEAFDADQMSTSVAAADFNNDGHLDIYVANYVTGLKTCPQPDGSYRPCDPASFDGALDQLLLNAGDGTFRDVSSDARIDLPNGKGLGVVAADWDDDGRIDLYVANDGVPNFLFHNSTPAPGDDPTFDEIGLLSGTALDAQGRSQAGMGIAVADFDGNEQLDLFVTNFYLEHNALYHNEGDLLFVDDTKRAGLFEPSLPVLGFGTQAADFDADGDADLFVANGHILHDLTGEQPWKMPAQLFQNHDGGQFTEVSQTAGPYFEEPLLGRGVARLDWNHDGRPDLAVVHQDRPAALLENRTSPDPNTLTLRLIGTVTNRNAVGAVLHWSAADKTGTLRWTSDGGYLASNSRDHILPVDPTAGPITCTVTWPDGTQTQHTLSPSAAAFWLLTEDARTFPFPQASGGRQSPDVSK